MSNNRKNSWLSRLRFPPTNDRNAWLNLWQMRGQLWRTEPEISVERKKFLVKRLAIVPDVKQGIYPFKNIKLSRADVEYLLEFHNEKYGPLAFVIGEPAKGLDLRGADLHCTNLGRLPLTQVRCGLQSADWYCCTIEQRDAAAAHFEGADLSKADLTFAILRSVHLEEANLRYAHLEGAHLQGAHLEGADLRNVSFNHETNLEEVILGNKIIGPALIADINWEGVNLAVVNWDHLEMIGDEYEAVQLKTKDGRTKAKDTRLNEYQNAVRANRQIAVTLQMQGLNEFAARFAYRGQKLQGIVLRRQKKFSQYLFFIFLRLLAGYGYKPIRSVIWYLGIIIGFAVAYHVSGHFPFMPDALVFSLASFHGRGFFPSFESSMTLHDPLVVLAALEAVIGLFIEISFIATFTQRYFGK